jgi:glucose/mannose-6-phosphate isomerase
MKKLIEEFAGQIERGLEIYKASSIQAVWGKFTNVVISGLGGSGIGGTIIRDLSAGFSNIPVLVNKEYGIPAFVGPTTLFIASSYSGDTEETLAAVEKAIEKKAHIICITSGGKLSSIAREHGLDLIMIPGGSPPRANLGYSLTQLIGIFSSAGFLPPAYFNDLAGCIGFLKTKESEIITKAKQITSEVLGKRIIIYSDASNEGVAVRFRQQLNENSKELCGHHVVPEMNHNELVGWTARTDTEAVIFIRNTTDHPRNQYRFEINKGIVSGYCPTVIEIWGEGNNPVERTMYTIHLVDWISYFLAESKGVDIMDIKVIDYLKTKLSEID